MEGYDPLTGDNPGEIPDNVQEIESVGEARHDFIGKRSKPSVVIALNAYFAGGLDKHSKSEEGTSESLHLAFNGGSDAIKADLRISTPHNLYTDVQQLTEDLFLDDHVRPLVFMISLENLESFRTVLNRLKDVLTQKYGLIPVISNGVSKVGVTHDAYKFDDPKGNPMDCHIIFSAATACDPQVTGEADMISAIQENRFQSPSSSVLVEGSSYWGTWKIETPPADRYLGATIILRLKGDDRDIILNIPKDLLAGPSVLDLAMIYDKIESSRGNMSAADMRTFIGDLSIKRNKPFSASIRDLYIQIINEGIRLFSKNSVFALCFIFFLKEIGDMSQHKVGVKYKHLALGSVDGLSTVAFLKRGGPLSYIPKENKRGEPCILFRCAGTLHVANGLTQEELEAQKAILIEEYEAKLQRKRELVEEAKRRALLKKADLEEARRLAILKLNEEREKKANERAQRAQRIRKQEGGSRWANTLKNRSIRNKTYKKGGALNVEGDILLLINALYMNLYNTLQNPGTPTSLFNINTLSEDFIDFTLVGEFSDKGYVVLDNKLLGLPLSSIIYILYTTLEDLEGPGLENQRSQIIKDFLIRFNFTDEEIARIQAYMNDLTLNEKLREIILSDVAEKGEVIRPLTQSDKDTLRRLDAEIPGIIPYDYYTFGRGTSYEIAMVRSGISEGKNLSQMESVPASENGYETEAQRNNLSRMESVPAPENGYDTEAQRKLTPRINPKAKPSIERDYEKKIRNKKMAKQNLIRRGQYPVSSMVFTRKQRKTRRNTTFKK